MISKLFNSYGDKVFSTLILLALALTSSSISFSHNEPSKGGTNSYPGTKFSSLLPEIPGKRLTVIELEFAPNSKKEITPHRHPGSVYVYVTKGSVRFALEGGPVKELHVGEGFFEPAGALHTIAENASNTEPATAIAFMILTDSAPILTNQ